MLKVTMDVNGLIVGKFLILNVGEIGDITKRQRRRYKVTYSGVDDYVEDGQEKEFYVLHYRENGVNTLVKKVLEKWLKIKKGKKR